MTFLLVVIFRVVFLPNFRRNLLSLTECLVFAVIVTPWQKRISRLLSLIYTSVAFSPFITEPCYLYIPFYEVVVIFCESLSVFPPSNKVNK